MGRSSRPYTRREGGVINSPHIRIALIAPKSTGKTTFAKALEDWYGFTRLSFADPVKMSVVYAVNAFLKDQGLSTRVTANDLNKNKEAFRLGMQWLGTEIMRDLCGRENHWVDSLVKRVSQIEDHATELQRISAIVVDDVRFQNEAAALKDRDFLLVKLIRNTGQNLDTHKSERSIYLIQPDHTIVLGGDADTTTEQAKHYGYEVIKNTFKSIKNSPTAEKWSERFNTDSASEVQQKLRQIGGVPSIKNAWR